MNITELQQAIAAKVASIRERDTESVQTAKRTNLALPKPWQDRHDLIKLLDQQSRMMQWCGHKKGCKRGQRKDFYVWAFHGCTCGLTDELKAIAWELDNAK